MKNELFTAAYKLESLSRRVRVLESIIIEGKKDQEVLHNFLGDKYFDKYNLIKSKIKDAEYKDIYKIVKERFR